ncbi:alpha/beta fold hydrolase [Streptomyces sp. NPDC058623]|uniref:alpha/beta fold hydrolase n=1 Tax=Streptomyces sp. NPDC058623 TaxID=3346563 RepID=UPI0036494C76
MAPHHIAPNRAGARVGATGAATLLALMTGLGPAIGGGATVHGGDGQRHPAGSRAAAAGSRFVPGACPGTSEPVAALEKARCGFLEVPENRARPAGRTIRLAVAIVPATSATPARDPVVFMAGGPGGDAFDDIPFLVDAGLNRDRPLIVMAQRGNLHSQPNLACPEIDRFAVRAVGLRYDDPATERLQLAATRECRDRLTADGTDLSAYNTTENAADFADLRTALGIPRWNVYAYSYGTDLALTYLREHPGGVRAVVLDSVTPPQTVSLPWTWGSAREGFDAVVRACAAQPRCKERYPDPYGTLTEQVRKLEAQPLTVDAAPPGGGKPVKVVLDGGALVNLLVGNAVPAAEVPAALDELARGNPQPFARARAAGAQPDVGAVAHGLTQSVACAEWVPGHTRSAVLAAGREAFPGWPDRVLAEAPQLPFQHEACGVWKVPDRTAVQRVPTVSSVPTLVVSGTFDMKTGASWGARTARTLSRSTIVRIPGIGHFVVPRSPCAQEVLASFFARPTAPDTRCVKGVEPKPFAIVPK